MHEPRPALPMNGSTSSSTDSGAVGSTLERTHSAASAPGKRRVWRIGSIFRFGFQRRWQACTPPVDTNALGALAWRSHFPVKLPRWSGILAAAFILPWAVSADPAPKAKAAKAPDPSFAAFIETPGLPQMLLIGDSISIGYTLPVRSRLAG
jgi:hypothetical protein